MRIAVLGDREMVYGFKLAGVDACECSPGPMADSLFDELVDAGDVAIIVLSRAIFAHLRDRIADLRSRHATPVVLALPGRNEEAVPESTARLLNEFLGLKV